MTRGYCLFLTDMLEACRHIRQFVAGMNFEQFAADEKTKSAVVRQLEILGEAAKNIPDALKDDCPQVPWKAITGMRDRLSHAYFKVDEHLVWQTVETNIPQLVSEITRLLREIDSTTLSTE